MTFDVTFNSPLQTVVSFAALLVWTLAVMRSDGPTRFPYLIVWIVCLLLAFASLTYLDAIPSDVTRGIQFAARVILLISGLLVVGHVVKRRYRA